MLHLLERQLGEGWHVLLKAHPHADAKCRQSTTDLAAEELFPVIDCLITDYSSTLFDYSIQKKPLVLYMGRCDGHATERILEWMRQGEATN